MKRDAALERLLSLRNGGQFRIAMQPRRLPRPEATTPLCRSRWYSLSRWRALAPVSECWAIDICALLICCSRSAARAWFVALRDDQPTFKVMVSPEIRARFFRKSFYPVDLVTYCILLLPHAIHHVKIQCTGQRADYALHSKWRGGQLPIAARTLASSAPDISSSSLPYSGYKAECGHGSQHKNRFNVTSRGYRWRLRAG